MNSRSLADGRCKVQCGLRLRQVLSCLLIALCCGTPALAQKFPEGFFSVDRVQKGEKLSREFCASCHLWPPPETLDRDTWLNGPLPWMMTVCGLSPQGLPAGVEGELIKQSGGVLGGPLMPRDDFGCIIAYYLHSAPPGVARLARTPVPLTLTLFRPRLLPFRSPDPKALLVKISDGAVLLGDGASNCLETLSLEGKILNTIPLNSTPVALKETTAGMYLACIGSFSPSEQPKGSLVYVPRRGGAFGPPETLLKNLKRPVHVEAADLNGDGRGDLVISMFGWYSGKLSWFENTGKDAYLEHELLAKPGALRTEIRDLNGDGYPDVATLVAQATEQLLFFYNDGKGQFTQKIIFQKHPAFGHSYLELADFNGDGRLDIVTANGDNGDYPSPPKPYHGVRIYLNRGADQFEEAFFFPLAGASKVLARDFDGDGDLDLACIAYYPDYRLAPQEGFVYLENQGGFKFSASTFGESAGGRWLTLDAGDLDGDGDLDLVLGAVPQGPGKDAYIPPDLATSWRKSGATVMLLENTKITKK